MLLPKEELVQLEIWMDWETIPNILIWKFEFGMGIQLQKFRIWTNSVMGCNIYMLRPMGRFVRSADWSASRLTGHFFFFLTFGCDPASGTYQSTDWHTSLLPVGTLSQLRVSHSIDWHFHRWLAFYHWVQSSQMTCTLRSHLTGRPAAVAMLERNFWCDFTKIFMTPTTASINDNKMKAYSLIYKKQCKAQKFHHSSTILCRFILLGLLLTFCFWIYPKENLDGGTINYLSGLFYLFHSEYWLSLLLKHI